MKCSYEMYVKLKHFGHVGTAYFITFEAPP